MAKTLIAYFSHAGENYFGGHIRSISKGNTAVAAEFVQKATGGTLFEIRTVKDYPVNYKACTDIAAEEGRANTRPELRGPLPDIGTYDTIVLGYPCWWGTMLQAVFTFLESADFTGKKILPFARTKEAENRARRSRFNWRIPKRSSSKHLQCADKRHKKWRMPQSATRSNGSPKLR